MTKVIGVRFKSTGRLYYFAPGELEINPGMHVIVETARGMEYGMAVSGVREIEDDKLPQGGLRPVLRIADPADTEQAARNREKEREAMTICKEKIRAHGLDMKLIDAEYTFDNSKVLFYFTADGRVDFRELVKDLAGVLRTRIELRQIGVRDETKILGGIGICGRPLCCHSYLTDFVPVSIRMAKEQNLSLNPTKISGVCGRLMCCLKNEEATYEYLNSRLPRTGDTVTTPGGRTGHVTEVSVLRQKVKVVIEENDEKEIQEYEVDELSFRPRRPRGEAAGAGAKAEKSSDAPRERSGESGKEGQSSEPRRRNVERKNGAPAPQENGGRDRREGRGPQGRRQENRPENRPESRTDEKHRGAQAEGAAPEGQGGERRRPRRRHHGHGQSGDREARPVQNNEQHQE